MSEPPAVLYEVAERVARITLDRPERGNGITLDLVRQLAECVERADLDPDVRVLLLAGNGPGFCGGYDLVESAEGGGRGVAACRKLPSGSRSFEIRPQTSEAVFSPIFGYNFSTRFHDSSSRGFVMIFRYASTSLMCACSKNRSPLRTE